MPEDDPRPAIHATSTGALRVVAVVLAVVLLLAAAMMALGALSTPRPSDGAAERPARHLVQIDVQSVRTAVDLRP